LGVCRSSHSPCGVAGAKAAFKLAMRWSLNFLRA
jgi:hypothetical protein